MPRGTYRVYLLPLVIIVISNSIAFCFFHYDGDATGVESAKQQMEMRRTRVRRPSGR